MTNINGNLPPAPSFSVSPADGSAPSSDDATAQALLWLGYMGLLASKYSALEAQLALASPSRKAEIQAEMNSILSQFNMIQGYYHLNGDTLTFDYDQGASSVQLTDPTLIALVQAMPSTPDKFAVFWQDTTDNPAISIIAWTQQDKFDFQNASPLTQSVALLFMLSTEAIPTGKMAGVAAQFLGIQRLFGNSLIVTEALCAFLHDNPSIDPDILADCLDIDNTTGTYKDFSDFFTANYKQWVQDPIVDEAAIMAYAALYWPEYPNELQQEKVVHAAPLSGKPNNEPKENQTDKLGQTETKRNKREGELLYGY